MIKMIYIHRHNPLHGLSLLYLDSDGAQLVQAGVARKGVHSTVS